MGLASIAACTALALALCVMNVNEGVGVPVEKVRSSTACTSRPSSASSSYALRAGSGRPAPVAR